MNLGSLLGIDVVVGGLRTTLGPPWKLSKIILHRDFSFILGLSNFRLLSLDNGQKPHSTAILSKPSTNAGMYVDMIKSGFQRYILMILRFQI